MHLRKAALQESLVWRMGRKGVDRAMISLTFFIGNACDITKELEDIKESIINALENKQSKLPTLRLHLLCDGCSPMVKLCSSCHLQNHNLSKDRVSL